MVKNKLIGPQIARQDTRCRRAISPSERLAICLRYLATGDSFRSLAFSYRVGVSTVAGIVSQVTRSIWNCLVTEYMPVPTKEDWRTIAAGFHERWNFPNCLGSIDGKHIVIQAPNNSGSMYHNYKGTLSIVLLAFVDASYCFRVVDVGAYGKTSDGGTLANLIFGQALRNGSLDLPEDSLLPGAEHLGPQPHVFVADEAFPLRRNLLRPFPGSRSSHRNRIYNYRLSRARMVVENTFGILAAQWRMYRWVIGTNPDNAGACVKATCILHNFMQITDRNPSTVAVSEGEAASALQNAPRAGSNYAAREAIRMREKFSNYFSAEGAVAWQDQMA
ncbi:uncharacterized protein LOC125803951 [Astyanax mexicanus]|uniref:uncharacterized protein LOC125803951 n=1 Tax=Astyanax mexicanus TaxID=7994 RepID=UPI0020CAC183|nr:uncharacterized protein LOC125803951 [Astyanax mexicanus]